MRISFWIVRLLRTDKLFLFLMPFRCDLIKDNSDSFISYLSHIFMSSFQIWTRNIFLISSSSSPGQGLRCSQTVAWCWLCSCLSRWSRKKKLFWTDSCGRVYCLSWHSRSLLSDCQHVHHRSHWRRHWNLREGELWVIRVGQWSVVVQKLAIPVL